MSLENTTNNAKNSSPEDDAISVLSNEHKEIQLAQAHQKDNTQSGKDSPNYSNSTLSESVAAAFHAAVYSGIQKPLHGLSQLFLNKEEAKTYKDFIINEPDQNTPVATLKWHMQALGGAAGFVADLAALGLAWKGLRKATDWTGYSLPKMSPLFNEGSLASSIAKSASIGGFYSGLTTPTEDNDNLLSHRLLATGGGALSFAAMSGINHGIAMRAPEVFQSNSFLNRSQRASIGILSGLGGGIAGGAYQIGTEKFYHNKELDFNLTAKELLKSSYEQMLVGAAFGAFQPVRIPQLKDAGGKATASSAPLEAAPAAAELSSPAKLASTGREAQINQLRTGEPIIASAAKPAEPRVEIEIRPEIETAAKAESRERSYLWVDRLKPPEIIRSKTESSEALASASKNYAKTSIALADIFHPEFKDAALIVPTGKRGTEGAINDLIDHRNPEFKKELLARASSRDEEARFEHGQIIKVEKDLPLYPVWDRTESNMGPVAQNKQIIYTVRDQYNTTGKSLSDLIADAIKIGWEKNNTVILPPFGAGVGIQGGMSIHGSREAVNSFIAKSLADGIQKARQEAGVKASEKEVKVIMLEGDKAIAQLLKKELELRDHELAGRTSESLIPSARSAAASPTTIKRTLEDSAKNLGKAAEYNAKSSIEHIESIDRFSPGKDAVYVRPDLNPRWSIQENVSDAIIQGWKESNTVFVPVKLQTHLANRDGSRQFSPQEQAKEIAIGLRLANMEYARESANPYGLSNKSVRFVTDKENEAFAKLVTEQIQKDEQQLSKFYNIANNMLGQLDQIMPEARPAFLAKLNQGETNRQYDLGLYDREVLETVRAALKNRNLGGENGISVNFKERFSSDLVFTMNQPRSWHDRLNLTESLPTQESSNVRIIKEPDSIKSAEVEVERALNQAVDDGMKSVYLPVFANDTTGTLSGIQRFRSSRPSQQIEINLYVPEISARENIDSVLSARRASNDSSAIETRAEANQLRQSLASDRAKQLLGEAAKYSSTIIVERSNELIPPTAQNVTSTSIDITNTSSSLAKQTELAVIAAAKKLAKEDGQKEIIVDIKASTDTKDSPTDAAAQAIKHRKELESYGLKQSYEQQDIAQQIARGLTAARMQLSRTESPEIAISYGPDLSNQTKIRVRIDDTMPKIDELQYSISQAVDKSSRSLNRLDTETHRLLDEYLPWLSTKDRDMAIQILSYEAEALRLIPSSSYYHASILNAVNASLAKINSRRLDGEKYSAKLEDGKISIDGPTPQAYNWNRGTSTINPTVPLFKAEPSLSDPSSVIILTRTFRPQDKNPGQQLIDSVHEIFGARGESYIPLLTDSIQRSLEPSPSVARAHESRPRLGELYQTYERLNSMPNTSLTVRAPFNIRPNDPNFVKQMLQDVLSQNINYRNKDVILAVDGLLKDETGKIGKDINREDVARQILEAINEYRNSKPDSTAPLIRILTKDRELQDLIEARLKRDEPLIEPKPREIIEEEPILGPATGEIIKKGTNGNLSIKVRDGSIADTQAQAIVVIAGQHGSGGRVFEAVMGANKSSFVPEMLKDPNLVIPDRQNRFTLDPSIIYELKPVSVSGKETKQIYMVAQEYPSEAGIFKVNRNLSDTVYDILVKAKDAGLTSIALPVFRSGNMAEYYPNHAKERSDMNAGFNRFANEFPDYKIDVEFPVFREPKLEAQMEDALKK